MGSIGLQKPDVRLEDLPEDARQLELGYWVGKPYWGRGYAPEAARALPLAFTTFPVISCSTRCSPFAISSYGNSLHPARMWVEALSGS